MKAKVKERINSRKKHAVVGKRKPVSVKKKAVSVSKRKPVNNSVSTKKKGHKFVKGQSGNPNGRPKGSKNKFSIAELSRAIKNVENNLSTKKKRTTFMEAWIESAWGNATDMATIANFMLPKLKSIEQLNVDAGLLDNAAYKNMCVEYSKRFDD